MTRLSLARPAVDAGILSEESVRDQLSAAEELLYVGHKEPAAVAAGAALEGALRFGAAQMAGPTASAGALLEALHADGAIDAEEHEILIDALEARDRLVHGYTPEPAHATEPERICLILQVAVRLLEPPVPATAAAGRV
ncbi:MAG TPA: hypothetical protein VGC98_09355 [Thermoleophilaceae bacterium]